MKLFTGVLEHVDPVSMTLNVSIYKSGKKNGLQTKTYTNQVLAEKRFYSNGLKTGIHNGFWESGLPKFEYHFNTNGYYHGSFKEWARNGQLTSAFNYLNGKEDGPQQMWTAQGKIRANYFVRNGERFGLVGLKKCFTINVDDQRI